MGLDRSSGIVLHPTSLASRGGIGDFGPRAYEFVDFLHAAKQQVWQVLPLNPTGWGDSPYAGVSAFAGNPLLISLEKLAEDGLLSWDRLKYLAEPGPRVEFAAVAAAKVPLIEEAARLFLNKGASLGERWERFQRFCESQKSWLNDYAYSVAIRRRVNGAAWPAWPDEFRRRNPEALAKLAEEDGDLLAVEQAVQFLFDEQWRQLRGYCAERGIRILGDVAIFVNYDSVDVWTNQDIFDLDEHLQPHFVSGVPPDYFSATGQRWGNPLYRWDVLEQRGFDWWIARIRRASELYDLVRLDHFRGFEAFWQIPVAAETAIDGQWVKAPGAKLFTALRNALGNVPFIAEDLGLITKEVTDLRDEFGMPGMRVLQFGFSDRGAHMHLPHQYIHNSVAYTGTHDNDSTRGWWDNGATPNEKKAAEAYLHASDQEIVWAMICAAETSIADLCIIPMQDVLQLGSESRMNTPSSQLGNWYWRMAPDALRPEIAERLAGLMEVTDRIAAEPQAQNS
jgi:4-alpha-glucanotransferase